MKPSLGGTTVFSLTLCASLLPIFITHLVLQRRIFSLESPRLRRPSAAYLIRVRAYPSQTSLALILLRPSIATLGSLMVVMTQSLEHVSIEEYYIAH